MFSVASLLTRILLALSITGSPVEVRSSRITLPMTRRLKAVNGTNLVQRDDTNIFMTNYQLIACVMVRIGIPPTHYNLVVDTGSSLTWIGGDPEHPYEPTHRATTLNGL
ncbi:hypothetical protein BDR07DRAFT_1495676 [Suillus spraguei]|nr:hypothetical protein BDR07DRAFT_1495676 [Suillus spraguei]